MEEISGIGKESTSLSKYLRVGGQPVRIPVSLHWLNTVRLLLI